MTFGPESISAMTDPVVAKVINILNPLRKSLFAEKYADRYRALKAGSSDRRFLVTRMGGTGSAWLAKVLNSHSDVFCSHEGILAQVYPRTTYDADDLFKFTERLAADIMHGAYRAFGDVGSAWLPQFRLIPRSLFTTAMLVRHPIRVLNTRLSRLPANDMSHREIDREQIEAIFDVDTRGLGPRDLHFLHDAGIWARSIVEALHFRPVEHVIRIEDLADTHNLIDVLRQFTGLEYSEALVKPFVNAPVNRGDGTALSTANIFSRFTDQQQHWYLQYIDPLAKKVGYMVGPEVVAERR